MRASTVVPQWEYDLSTRSPSPGVTLGSDRPYYSTHTTDDVTVSVFTELATARPHNRKYWNLATSDFLTHGCIGRSRIYCDTVTD